MHRYVGILAALATCWAGAAAAGPAEDAQAVVDKWAAAYSANDPEAALKLYTREAILLGTVSSTIASTPDARRAYFSRLPGTGNKTQITERKTQVLGDSTVVASGFYTFAIMRDGKPTDNPARYTMVLVKEPEGWMIAHHHSSPQPRGSQ
jgi:uncharacterized protein (TIGR02246 family)